MSEIDHEERDAKESRDRAELQRLGAVRDGLIAWRADVEAATLDHGWQITKRIDALLALAAEDA